MVTEIYYRKALAQIKNKYSLLEDEHAEMKKKHSKLQEEYLELLNDRNDLEGDTWLWMMENKKLQADHTKLQAEHSQWKAACASLVEEVERKVLEEEYLAYLEQEYGLTHWPVAKVAELEVELERKLAEAHQLVKEREQALMDKVAALESELATLKVTLKSEVASLQNIIQRKDDDFDGFRWSSKKATHKLVTELAEAKAETVQHDDVSRSLRKEKDAIESGVMTALGMLDILEQSMFGKPVEVPAPTQQDETLVVLQEQRPSGVSSNCSSPMSMSLRTSTKTSATPATVKEAAKPVEVPAPTLQDRMRKWELEMIEKKEKIKWQTRKLSEKSSSSSSPSTVIPSTTRKAPPATLLKVPAQTQQRPVREQELTKPKEINRVPSKATSSWEHYKSQRSGPSSVATSSTSSSPEISPRSAA